MVLWRLAGAVLALVAVPSGARAMGPYEWRADQLAAEIAARQGNADAVAPLAALARLEEDLPPGRLADILRTMVTARAHPLVAAQAAYQLSLDEDRRGQDDQARVRRRALGLWQDFWVVGPFDAQGRSGLDRVYPPERGTPDPRRSERFAGKEREVGWRRVPALATAEGALVLDALLRPESDAVAYVLAVVNSQAARSAVVRVGSAGPVKIWLNGAKILDRNVVRPATLDQNAAAVSLRAGENWMLVKTVVTAGAWRLFLRFTDGVGHPLAGLTPVADPRGPAPRLVPGEGRARATFVDLAQILRRRAESAPASEAAGRWLDQARFLTLVAPDDAEAKPVERALRAACAAPASSAAVIEALLLLGEVAREEDDRRAALERAAAAGDRCLALHALGTLARRRRHEAAALGYWRQAVEGDAECWPAQLTLAYEEQGAGLPVTALARLDALPAAVKTTARVARTRIRMLEAVGRRGEAETELATLLRAGPGDPDLLQDLAAAARSRGDLRRAAELYTDAAARRPEIVFLTMEAARAREGLGDLPAARALLAEAADRLPDEPRLFEELGRLLARADRVPDALVALERSLLLRPQNPTLRHYRERLAADGGQAVDRSAAAEDLARRFAADAEALARDAVAPAPAADGRADGLVVLLDRRVVRVHGNGLSESFVQRVIQVRTARAARDNQELLVRYSPGAQEAEIRIARLLRRGPSGELEVSEATGRDDRDLSEPWAGLYYDNRAAVVSYEGLRAGDVIELQYTLADVALRNEMADYFGDFQLIGDTSPKRRWDYTLIGPAGRTFFFNQPRIESLVSNVERQGPDVVYRFSATDVARVVTEPSMPGFAEVAPYLHVSTYRSWQDVARWYWSLVEDQLTPDDALRRAATDATARLTTDIDKVRALHSLVLERTRYVGLEFGIHGYKPYKVTQVLTRGFGDCKDKASLLLALLRETGIDAELVLVRTRRGGHIDPVPASLAVFDHAIVFVPALGLYLDGTAEYSGMGELPGQDQGVMVLRVGPRTAILAETPVFPASANRAARVWRAQLDGEGGAQIVEDLTISGQAAPDWRVHYQTPGERQERLAKVWSGRFPGARIDDMSFEGIEDRNHPVVVHSRVHVPHLGESRTGGELYLPITSRDGDFVRSYARLSQRRHDLQVAYPWQHEEELVFHLPAGWTVLRRPATRHEKGAFGRFDLEVTPAEAGRAVRVRSLIEIERNRISPAEYGAFRKFLGTIDGALGERLVLGKEDGG